MTWRTLALVTFGAGTLVGVLVAWSSHYSCRALQHEAPRLPGPVARQALALPPTSGESGAALRRAESRIASLEAKFEALMLGSAREPEGAGLEVDVDSNEKTRMADELAELHRRTHREVTVDRLRTEVRDPDWSERYEQDARSRISQAFAGTEVADIDCRSTVCEAHLVHQGAKELHAFVDNFPSAIEGFDEAHYEVDESDPERPAVTLHLVRAGSGDEFNDELGARISLASTAQ